MSGPGDEVKLTLREGMGDDSWQKHLTLISRTHV